MFIRMKTFIRKKVFIRKNVFWEEKKREKEEINPIHSLLYFVKRFLQEKNWRRSGELKRGDIVEKFRKTLTKVS